MSKKREIEQLISEAVEQGIKFEYLPSGHWKATNPKTKQKKHIASTPSSNRGVTNARSSLIQIGFVPKRPPKKKKKQPAEAPKEMAIAVVTKTEETPVPKLGEMAQIRKAITAEEVKNNIPMAAYVLWEAIHLRMRSDSTMKYEDRNKVMGGIPGKVWEGSRSMLIDAIWPDLETHTKTRIGAYLTGSKNMATVVRGQGNTHSIWWISDEFREITEYKAKYTKSNWYEDGQGKIKTYPSDNYVRGKYVGLEPDSDGYYRCAKCTFATKKLTSFQPHIGKLGDREHPNEGTFECRFCPDILPTADTMKQHHVRKHKDTGTNYCASCVAYYDDVAPLQHKRLYHSRAASVTETAKKLDQVEQVMDQQKAVEVQNDEVETPRGYAHVKVVEVSDAEKAIQTVLDEISRLRVDNMDLRVENSKLRKENEELRVALEPLRQMFTRQTS